MSHYKPYSTYQRIDAEWIKQAPEHWKVKRMKFAAPLRTGKTSAKNTDMKYIGLEHVESWTGRLVPSNDDVQAEGISNIFKAEDVLFGKLRPYLAKATLVDSDGLCSSEFLVLRAADIFPKFLLRLTLSHGFVTEVDSSTYGTKMPRANWEFVGNLPTVVPPPDEQQSIIGHLDRETARIDALIEKKTRFIELLKEKRQALITQAVTKGLDPTVPMKDSGVEWIGEVPAHWRIAPLRTVVSYQEGPGIMAADFRDEGTPLLRIGNLGPVEVDLQGCNYVDPKKAGTKWAHFKLDESDYLISASASSGMICKVGKAGAGTIPYTGLIRLQPIKNGFSEDWLPFFFVSGQFLTQIELQRTGTTIQHFGPTHLSRMVAAVPPPDEQATIATILRGRVAKLDELVAASERSINLLTERRSALITAAVTGQIDLREDAA